MSQRIFPITMPKWGIEMQQGTITEWHAAPGQAVGEGRHAARCRDRENRQLGRSAGRRAPLRRILADVGATEAVGALIAVFAATDVADAEVDAFIAGFRPADTSFEPDGGTSSDRARARAAAPPRPTPATARQGQPDCTSARRASSASTSRKIKGTGSHGRVSKEDVEAYAAHDAGWRRAARTAGADCGRGATATRRQHAKR